MQEFSAAIALSFRIDLVNMFFAGDLYAGTGVDRRSEASAESRRFAGGNRSGYCATSRSAEYFTKVFAPYYLQHRPNSTAASLIADNRLDIIGDDVAQQRRLLRADQQRRSDTR